MKKTILSAAAVAVVFGLGACAVPEDGTTHADRVVAAQDAQTATSKPAAKPASEPEYTVTQKNAIAMASDYLDTSAFSRKGLIEQLKYEGFTAKVAAFAVDHIEVNWNKQAAATAQSYLETSAFSRQGLIDQLRYEGFTASQAEYGVDSAGL